MPRFRIESSQLCTVTWTYEVEATDKDAALRLLFDGEAGEPINHDIGDGYADTIETVTQIGE